MKYFSKIKAWGVDLIFSRAYTCLDAGILIVIVKTTQTLWHFALAWFVWTTISSALQMTREQLVREATQHESGI